MWKRLKHPNIVPFIGVTRNPMQFVSEWMPNGTLPEYVNENPGANRISLVSSSVTAAIVLMTPFSSYWMWQKVLPTFMQITPHMET